MNRTLVVGDIHGGLKALVQVFKKAAIDASDKLIFLGDYVDGWSESAEVLNYLMTMAKQQSCIFLKGNHDEWCEAWLRTGQADKTWLQHGGQATIKSYSIAGTGTHHAHLAFFESMKLYEVDDKNRLFVHAGFTSMHGPHKEAHPANLSWDRTLWEVAITLDKSIDKNSLLYPKRLKLFDEIYIGHTPTLYFDVTIPMQGANVWNIDTGAAFKGRLSVMDIDTKLFWQSDPVKDLYPGEAGRNAG